MKKPQYNNDASKLLTVEQAKQRYKVCRATLMKIATDAGAVRRFGRSVRIDVPAMDSAIETYQ